MINIALLAITGATILNSTAIIVANLAIRKRDAEIEKLKSDAKWKDKVLDSNYTSLNARTDKLRKDLKSLYKEISETRHTFISKQYATLHILSGERELVDYVAEVALKTIASELPEEERTLEMIDKVIIPKIREKLNDSHIKL